MLKAIKTDYGNIEIQESLLENLIEEIVAAAAPSARFAEGDSRFRLRSPGSSSLVMGWEEEVLHIDLNLIVKFGISISKVTEDIMNQIYDRCQMLFGIEKVLIRATVTGVETKNNVTKRNIEFTLER